MNYKHPSGEEFKGRIGRNHSDSQPWWPDPRLPKGKPDIVLVVLDDTGFSHLGCYGSSIATPHTDALAAGGLRYTGFHTTALCSPTRACLLTGRNHHAVGMRSISNLDTGFPNMRGAIPPSAATLPDLLRDSGYATFAVGKWHLAPMAQCSAAGPFHNWPLQRGFDRFYGFMQGETDHFRPELTQDNGFVDPPGDPADGYHLSEDLVEQAMRMVRDTVSLVPERPFFLYTAFGATHAPHQAPKEWMDKYRGSFDRGWDEIRAEWYARQQQMKVIPDNAEMAPRNPGVRPWQELSNDEQRFANRLQEAFAAMLDHTDHQIGRLVSFLREIGRLDNTLFVLMSDNGASQEGGALGVMDEMRYFNGIDEDLSTAIKRLDDIGGPHSHTNIPWGWAQVGNTPLKWYKQNTHGGGVRDPLVVHWPDGIADKGSFRRSFCHAIDLAPTLLEVADVPHPDSFRGVPQMPVHGASMQAGFHDAQADVSRPTQYFEMQGHRGIWHQGWKAVTHHARNGPFVDDRWELYHLDEDFSECHDRAAQEPAKLKEMDEIWWAEAEKHGVLPLDDRRSGLLFRASRQPGLPTARDHFVFYPPISRVVSDASPPMNRGWTLIAHLEHPTTGGDGALMARGNINSGCVLYIQNGYLHFDYNFFHDHTVLKADRKMPAGEVQATLEVVRNPDRQNPSASCRLLIGEREVARGLIPRILNVISSIGMDIGRSMAPICDGYDMPFSYGGNIRKLEFKLPPRRPGDKEAEAERQARIAMSQQ